MSENTPTSRPQPVPDTASQPFFDAAAEGRLLIKYCPVCTRHLAPAADMCDACHSLDLEWKQASGRGTLYSFVIDHEWSDVSLPDEVPYNVIVVELEEGPRVKGNYAGDNADLRVDMPLKVTFARMGDVSVPKWVRP